MIETAREGTGRVGGSVTGLQANEIRPRVGELRLGAENCAGLCARVGVMSGKPRPHDYLVPSADVGCFDRRVCSGVRR